MRIGVEVGYVGWLLRDVMAMAATLALFLLPGLVAGQTAEKAGGVEASQPSAVIPGAGALLTLQRLDGEIDFDGLSDEATWAAIEPLPMVQHWPDFGAAMSRRTEIRVAYDDEYLWASGRFYDDPEGISANSLQRDLWDGDDAFDIIVDSFNDNQTALKFTTTPLGTLLDAEILNDAQFGGGVPAMNTAWNTFWDARTQQTDEGWFAEIRIPLSSLGFDVQNDRAVMGLIAGRYIARSNEKHLFPAIPPDWDMADFKPSQAQDMELRGVPNSTPLWITPYLLTGVDRTREPNRLPVTSPTSDFSREVGLDVKYGLSSNLTLDLTVNTDFAQVESDALQVNLDRFSLFFPEKRQFFQERSSTFRFALSEDNQLFYSRRIGLSDEGTPLRIFGGGRVAGRIGEWDLGVLSMQVDGGPVDVGPADGGPMDTEPTRPDENVAALRLRRTVLGSGRVGGIFTSRVRTDGGTDISVGADGEIPFGDERVTLQVAHTKNEEQPAAAVLQRSSARIFWERRSLRGFGYDASLTYSGPGYDPRLGFEARNDYTATQGRLAYVWDPEGDGPVDRYRFQTVTRSFWRNEDRSVESWLGRLQLLMDLSGGHWWNVTTNLTREDVRTGFDLPGATVSPGTFWNLDLFTRFESSRARTLSGAVTMYAGGAFDGYRFNLLVEPQVSLSRHLSVGAAYDIHRLWFPDRDQRVKADLARLRVRAALDSRLSAEAFLQYSAVTDALSTNFRVRYRFAEGRDLFIVVDEARDFTDRFGLQSVLGPTDRRLLVKYSWTFQP